MIETLLKIPSVNEWYSEMNLILNGSRDSDIDKHGSPSSYIDNLIISSNNVDYSKYCFLESFDKYFINKKNMLSNLKFLYISIDICNYYELFSNIEKISNIVSEPTMLNNTNVDQKNICLRAYCLYILNALLKKYTLPRTSNITQKIIAILDAIIGTNITISSISLYLIVILTNRVLVLKDINTEIRKKLINYLLKYYSLVNHNNIKKNIINLYISDKEYFEIAMRRNSCQLSNDRRYIIYKDNPIIIYLNPTTNEWEKLIPKEENLASKIVAKFMENLN